MGNVLQRRKIENLTAHRIAADFDHDYTFDIEEIEDIDDFADEDIY